MSQFVYVADLGQAVDRLRRALALVEAVDGLNSGTLQTVAQENFEVSEDNEGEEGAEGAEGDEHEGAEGVEGAGACNGVVAGIVGHGKDADSQIVSDEPPGADKVL